MALSPVAPAPLPPWAKAVLQIAPYVWATIDHFYDYKGTTAAPAHLEWRYVTLRWTRATPVGTTEAVAQIGFHIANITAGDLDATWTTQDYVDCETALTEWLSALNPKISSTHTMVDYRWYVKKFAEPMLPNQRFSQSGPPARITVHAQPGGATGSPLPYQVAMSVTFKTAAPRHWGRVYIPGLTPNDVDTNGRWGPVTISLVANQTAELVDDLAAKGFQLAVPMTQHDGSLVGALNTVTGIQVDDIPDVIRRRRLSTAKIRTQGVPLP